MSYAKTAEPVEMPFGLTTRVGPWNHVLDGIQIPMGMGSCEGDKGQPIVNYRELCKNDEPITMPFGFGVGWAQGTIETSVCDAVVACYQITLTMCFSVSFQYFAVLNIVIQLLNVFVCDN